MLLQGGHFEHTDPTLYVGKGGGGGGGIGGIVKKAQVYHDFGPGLYVAWMASIPDGRLLETSNILYTLFERVSIFINHGSVESS